MATGWGHRPQIPFGESIRQWLQHARQSSNNRGRDSETLPSQVTEFRPRPLARPEPKLVEPSTPAVDDLSLSRIADALGLRGSFASVLYSREGRMETLARRLAQATSARLVDVSPATEGWRLGEISERPVIETRDQIRWLVANPEALPPGGPSESFSDFRRRWLGWLGNGPLRGGLADWGRVAIVTHSSNLRLAQDWIALGCPADLDLTPEVLLGDSPALGPIARVHRRPGDPSWRMDDFPAEGGSLPPGVYLIQHDADLEPGVEEAPADIDDSTVPVQGNA